MPPKCAVELCPQKVNISRAVCSLAADVESNASLTGIGTEVPTIATPDNTNCAAQRPLLTQIEANPNSTYSAPDVRKGG